jgi:hypothetical protein
VGLEADDRAVRALLAEALELGAPAAERALGAFPPRGGSVRSWRFRSFGDGERRGGRPALDQGGVLLPPRPACQGAAGACGIPDMRRG